MFSIDPDKPRIPAIARILSGLGLLSLIVSVGSMMLAFSGFPWVNQTFAMAGAVAGFLLGVVMIGQAKTIELLAVVSARVRSRFALEGALAPTVQPAAAAPLPKSPAPIMPTKERVITIPEEVARQQGVTRRRELD
jgi:hypothetical protein